MPVPDTGKAGFRVDGLYERLRERELTVALSPDPRLTMIADPVERERASAAAPRFAPTALGQTEALLARQPVTVPRWALSAPAVREWPPYRDRRVYCCRTRLLRLQASPMATLTKVMLASMLDYPVDFSASGS